MSDVLSFFIPLTKRDDEKRMVYGYASTEAVDHDGEVIDRAAIIDALPDYLKFGNIREMHSPIAAGKLKEYNLDEKGLYIGAKVVDDSSWDKVKEGVLSGFSVGGKKLAKIGNRITKIMLSEISLVDRPNNPECVVDAFKAFGIKELVNAADLEKMKRRDAVEPLVKAWQERADPKLKKGLFELADVAQLYAAFGDLKTRIKAEQVQEADSKSKLPGMADAICDMFEKLILTMSAEEVGELRETRTMAKFKKDMSVDEIEEAIAEYKKMKKDDITEAMKKDMEELEEALDEAKKAKKADDMTDAKKEAAKKLDEMTKGLSKVMEKLSKATKKIEEADDVDQIEEMFKDVLGSLPSYFHAPAKDRADSDANQNVYVKMQKMLQDISEQNKGLSERLAKIEDKPVPTGKRFVQDKTGEPQELQKFLSGQGTSTKADLLKMMNEDQEFAAAAIAALQKAEYQRQGLMPS